MNLIQYFLLIGLSRTIFIRVNADATNFHKELKDLVV